MISNLVKRLRDWQHVHPEDEDKPEGHLYEEAADRIEELEAENKRLREALEWQNKVLRKHITENDLPAHRLLLPDGSCHTGPVVDWLRDVFTKWSEINTQALAQTSTPQEGEE